MKKLFFSTLVACGLMAGSVQAQLSPDSVFVQIIHNSPDPAADTVDVWFYVPLTMTEYKAVPDLAFRTATPVVTSIPGAPVGYIPADLPFEVRIKTKGSTTATVPVYTKNFPSGLPKGSYHIIAQGVVDQDLVDSLGAGASFDLVGYPNAAFSAHPDSAALRIVHGAPDAPGVRIFAGVTTFTFASVVDSLEYLEGADATIKVKPLRIWISPQGGSSAAAIAKYNANAVQGLGGLGAVVFASGLLNTSIGTGLPSFGLFAALPNGAVVALPAEKLAGTVQIVHNAADPALASSVAAFVSGDKLPLNLNFRGGFQSTSFIADFDYSIGLAPNNGSTPAVTFPATQFAENENRVIFVNGVLDPTQFKANPDGFSTALNLYSFSPAKFAAGTSNETEILVFHGATDAPHVDVFVPLTNSNIVNNLGYGSYTSSYLGPLPSVALTNAELQVKDSSGANIVTRHLVSAAQATAVTGKAVVAFASGFLDTTAANQNGKSFGLFVVIDNGGPQPTVVELAKILPSSIVDLNDNVRLRMYPNPASTDLFVTLDVKDNSNVSVEILDLNGRVVKNVLNSTYADQTINQTVDIRDLNSGLYIAKVKSDNKVSTIKFNVVR